MKTAQDERLSAALDRAIAAESDANANRLKREALEVELAAEREAHAKTRAQLEEMTAWHKRANEHRLEALRDRRLNTCTPAERKVLDAMAGASIIGGYLEDDTVELRICAAELARRGEKP